MNQAPNAIPRRRGRTLLAALAALAVVGCGSGADATGQPTDATSVAPSASATAAPSAAPSDATGPLAPLADGFPSEAITLWAANAPGHPDDLFNKIVADIATQYSPVRISTQAREVGPGIDYEFAEYIAGRPGADEGYQVWSGSFFGPTLRLYSRDSLCDKNLTDIQPVLAMEEAPFIFVAPLDSPYETLQNAIDAAKAGDVKAVGSGTGSGLHTSLLLLGKQAGVDFTFIPTEGAGESRNVLLGAGAQFGALTYEPGIEEQLKVLAVTGDVRVSALSDVPTVAELGFDVPSGSERGIISLPTVSNEHRAWLYELFKRISQDPDFQAARSGFEFTARPGDEVRERQEKTIELFVPILSELGLVVCDRS